MYSFRKQLSISLWMSRDNLVEFISLRALRLILRSKMMVHTCKLRKCNETSTPHLLLEHPDANTKMQTCKSEDSQCDKPNTNLLANPFSNPSS